ncbi:hypothetical protein PVT71_20550 [Salipiger sp. H15]|uniref:Pyridoxamine 5'-phosphate oxidase n=1 Tax=Alloyangia sp. H15 TaxID=3029062 RepID=A0AAU8AKJ2_9RHOB
MNVDDRLLDFFDRPLMCIIAATDGGGRPAAGRGIGFALHEDRATIDLLFSAWQWPRLETCIREVGKLAATFVSPSDYVSFQLKGAAVLRAPGAADRESAGRFIASATRELESLGVATPLIEQWLTASDARVARMSIREIYHQTPGPLAGMSAGTGAR